MEVRTYLGADAQAFELVQPGESALDHPADLAQTGPVRDAAARDLRRDPVPVQQSAVLVVVVATVGEQPARATPRSASSAADVGDRLDERQELGDVVPVSASQRHCQGCAVPVDEDVMFAARTAPIDR